MAKVVVWLDGPNSTTISGQIDIRYTVATDFGYGTSEQVITFVFANAATFKASLKTRVITDITGSGWPAPTVADVFVVGLPGA